MRKGILIGLMVVALLSLAGAAYAEVQNVKVSGDILMRAFGRYDYDLKKEHYFDPVVGVDDEVQPDKVTGLMSIIRLRVDADLTDNVSTTVRLLNERRWDNEAADTTDIDLDLGYVAIKEFFYAPLTVTVGRQELHFGNDMIMGDINTNRSDYNVNGGMTNIEDWSARKSFDAIRATLTYNPWTIDLVYSILDKGSINLTSMDRDLIGINARHEFGKYNAVAEVYYWYKKGTIAADGTIPIDDTRSTPKPYKDKIYCFGLRGNAEPMKDLVLNAEMAWQLGHFPGSRQGDHAGITRVSGDRQAMAVQTGVDYTFSKMKYIPKVGLWFSWFSGDKGGETGGTYHNWDPMFENQTAGSIANYLFAMSDCYVADLKASMKPLEDLTLFGSVTNLWLAKAIGVNQWLWVDAQGNATANRTNQLYEVRRRARYLGCEMDLGLTYDYTEDVQLGVLCGWYWPGNVFVDQNKATAQLYSASMKVAF